MFCLCLFVGTPLVFLSVLSVSVWTPWFFKCFVCVCLFGLLGFFKCFVCVCLFGLLGFFCVLSVSVCWDSCGFLSVLSVSVCWDSLGFLCVLSVCWDSCGFLSVLSVSVCWDSLGFLKCFVCVCLDSRGFLSIVSVSVWTPWFFKCCVCVCLFGLPWFFCQHVFWKPVFESKANQFISHFVCVCGGCFNVHSSLYTSSEFLLNDIHNIHHNSTIIMMPALAWG